MAGQVKVLETAFTVDNNVNRYEAVVQGTAEQHAVYASADNTGVFLGITDDGQSSGYVVPVVMAGTVWAKAGAAISLGDNLVVGANGTVKTAVGVATPVVIGKALQAATQNGDIILIKLA